MHKKGWVYIGLKATALAIAVYLFLFYIDLFFGLTFLPGKDFYGPIGFLSVWFMSLMYGWFTWQAHELEVKEFKEARQKE